MSTEDNKAIARRYLEELYNQKNLAIVDELNTPDFMLHMTQRRYRVENPTNS